MRMDHTACLSLHAEGNNRAPARTSSLLYFLQQIRFHIIRVDDHLAGGNLFITRAVKTKFAHSQAAVRSHGRTKRAASHRPGIVKIAQSGLRIEHRTDLIVRKFREPLLRLRTFVEHARSRIARKLRRQSPNRISRPQANPARPLRIRLFKISEPLLQPDPIQLIDGKYTHTALRASRTTHQPLAATPRGIGQSTIHDLDQRPISSRQSPQRHVRSIPLPCVARTLLSVISPLPRACARTSNTV